MAALIEFAVIGQVGFRRHGEDLAAQNEDRAIIEPLAMTQRRADDDQEVQRARGVEDVLQRHLDAG